MKLFFIYLALVLPIMFYSCGNESIMDDENETFTSNRGDDYAKMQEVATLLTGLTVDVNAVSGIREGIERNLTYGFDEELRFADILLPNKSKMLRSSKSNILAESVRNLLNNNFSSNSLRSSSDNIEEFLINDNIQIYWPYYENWDGKETPVITFDHGTKNADKVIAYRAVKLFDGNSAIDSLIVDEVYAMEHPVWVINKNKINYEDLPDFINGENEKNGIIYNILNQKNIINPLYSTQLRAASKRVYEFSLSSMRVTKQYDDWLSGGSEFRLVCYFPTSQFGLAKNGILHVHFTRKDISKGREKNINFILNYDWSEDQLHNMLKIWESDPGREKNVEIKMITSYSPKDENGKSTGLTVSGEFKTNLKIGKRDDDVMEKILPRTTFMTPDAIVNSSKSRKQFEERGVSITCEINAKDKIDF